MSIITADFDSWLSTKLQDLNTDESVFGSYIKGILEGEDTEDEKTEALAGILAGITEENITKHITDILEAWAKWGHVEVEATDDIPKEDVDVRLARLLESQSLATTSHKSNYTAEEKRIREAILAQYSQTSDQEESEGESDDGEGGGDSGLQKNTNASNIAHAEREKRERAKLESQKKKEKDKEDREKQKQLKEEKKEKRKTVKGERRR